MSQSKSEIAAWYVSRGGDATGPFSTDMLLAMLRNSQLQPLDLVFREGESEWKPVATYRELKANAKESDATNSVKSSPEPSSVSASSAPSGPAAAVVPSVGKSDPRTLQWIVLRPHNSTYLQEGPLETQTIIEGLEKGRFQFSQYAWHAGMSQWMRIGDLREFDRRSRSRESKPHVPPPLPDPIAAVMLEDDRDSDAEEFHISMRGNLKHDLTPNPLESMQAISQLGSAAIGGAAAESPEQKASRAVSLVVSPGNLAGVPWEQDASDGYAQAAVELIDDQHSGIHSSDLFGDDGLDQFTFTGSIGAASLSGVKAQVSQVSQMSQMSLAKSAPADTETPEERLERTPLPFLPSAPMPLLKDTWNKWGRHVAGGAMFCLLCVFTWHLMTYESSPLMKLKKSKPEAAMAPTAMLPAAHVAPAAPVMEPSAAVDDFGKDAPDAGLPSTRATAAAKVEKTEKIAVVAPVAAPVSAPVIPAPIKNSKELGIVGLKLDKPEAQLVIQGMFPPNTPIAVTFKGRLGQILSKISVRKTVMVSRKGGEIPTLRLKNLRLPTGSYTVEVKVGEATAKNEIFVGSRDAKFLDNLETHLRDISLETQTQKKVLFYAAQEMNVLARDLGQNYGQLRGKPELWASFYTRWKQRMEMVSRSTGDVSRRPIDDQAFPEETAALLLAQTNLKDVANQYELAIGQSRDMASDSLTELIAELTRQKESIGQMSARPGGGE